MRRALASDLGEVPGAASYRPVYRDEGGNRCPGCGRSHWHVGRFSAECAFCGTALALQEGSVRSAWRHEDRPIFFTRRSDGTTRKTERRTH